VSAPGAVAELDARRRPPPGAPAEPRTVDLVDGDDTTTDPVVTYGRLNPFSGTPADLVVEDLCPAGPPAQGAVDVLEATAPVLGLAPDQVEFVPDPEVVRTSTGATVVHLQQHHLGIPVFEMVRTVVFGPDGCVRRVIGENHALAAPLLGDAPDAHVPGISAAEAAALGAAYLAGDDERSALRDWMPRVVTAFALAARPTVLDAGPFTREVPAHLVFFGWEAGDTHLAWRLVFDRPTGQWVVIVDARAGAAGRAGAVRYCRRTTTDLRTVHARVYPEHPGAGDRSVTLPLAASGYRLPVPPAVASFPRDWCFGPDTDGNFARVTDGDNRPWPGRVEGDAVVFDRDDPMGPGQCMVNAFYLCSLFHDLFLLLGFDEVSKNFEAVGTGAGGLDGDPVVVRVRDDSDWGEAHMTCRPDGEPPIMVLGRSRATGRPTALDADVVLHEYVHGVTTRLVGGLGNPSSLEPVQSAALGEGWSDYFALTLQNHLHGTDRTRLGTWSTGTPEGLRVHAYDEDFPDHFGHLGTGRYDEAHAIGEIWAAALVQAHRELARVVDPHHDPAAGPDAAGGDGDPAAVASRLGWRIVLDGLRLTRSSPGLLDARDAVLDAAADIDAAGGTGLVAGARAEDVYRRVFARFGMGVTARSHGPLLDGIVACHRF
jgi:extracellular elastinolytic metalloproteinase